MSSAAVPDAGASSTAVPGAGTSATAVPVTRSPRASARLVPAALVLLVLLVAGTVASLAVGSRPVAPGAVLSALLGDGDGAEALIVRELRLPRTVTAIVVGCALGVAGLLMQAVTRNPLADPGLLGVNAGASAGVVGALAFAGVGTASGYVWFAFAGAAAAATLVHLAGGRDRSGPVATVLAGVALGACLSAVIGIVTLLDEETFESYRFWVVGSLERRELDTVAAVAPFIALGLVVAVLAAPGLDQLALGEDSARALGVRPRAVTAASGVAITLLCGAATAAAGPLSFVGLLIAHLVRRLVGPALGPALPLAALGGAVLLLTSDVAGRLIAAPAEVEVGIVTAFLGAPMLFVLATRSRVER